VIEVICRGIRHLICDRYVVEYGTLCVIGTRIMGRGIRDLVFDSYNLSWNGTLCVIGIFRRGIRDLV
jgi:hypothetical protein